MHVRSEPRALAVPLAARPAHRLDYLKLVVWIAGALLPWAGIAALCLGR